MATAHTNSVKNIDELNSLLEGEISAVETYRIALDKLDDDSMRSTLNACLRSHQQRVTLLQEKVRLIGGQPSETSGAWGAFAKTAEKASVTFGDNSGISTLETGEDHGLKIYRTDDDKYSPEVRSFIRQDLLPLQEETHRMMSQLKHSASDSPRQRPSV